MERVHRYFAQRFDELGIKKLIATNYAHKSKRLAYPYRPTPFEQQAPHYKPSKSLSRGKIFTLTEDANQDGRIDLADLQWTYLKGDGDFRSGEVRKLRNEADIIVTTPPFSLFQEFVEWLYEAKKKFTI